MSPKGALQQQSPQLAGANEVPPSRRPPPPKAAPRPQGILPRAGLELAPETLEGTRLILFRAPSGYGKTVAMGQLREHLSAQGYACAWLTLSGYDQSADRLLRRLGHTVTQLLEETGSLLADSAATEIERLAAIEGPFALFLDEAETIREDGSMDILRELLAQFPPNGVLVVGTQRIPHLALTRLRLRGQLIEFRPTELRFTLPETEAFLVGLEGHRLGPDDLAKIYAKTEGWPAAVRMVSAALAQQSRPSEFIARFSGSDLAIGDYLTEEFLNELAPDLWSFLLRTSILEELTPDLCRAICPQQDTDTLLAELQSSNVLITRSEAEGGSLRYHNLLLGYLQGQLRLHMPAEIAPLHLRASAWFEAEGRMTFAIEHAVRAQDHDRALSLLSRHGPSLLERGRLQLLARWFAAIPEEALKAYPALAMVRVWAVCFTAGPDAARTLIEAPWLATLDAPAIAAERACVWPMILAMKDDFLAAEAAGKIAQTHLAAASPYAQNVTQTCIANIHLTLDRPEDDAAPAQDDSPFSLMYSESVQGLRDLQENRFLLAKARFRIAALSHSGTGLALNGNVWAGIPYALTLYEGGDVLGAAQILRLQLPIAMSVGLIDHVIASSTYLSRIAAQAGEMDQAIDELVRLERYGLARGLPRVVAGALLERCRLFLGQGNLRAAADQLRRAQDAELWSRIRHWRLMANDLDSLVLGQIRLDLHMGRAPEALRAIRIEATEASLRKRGRRALLLRLLESAALHQSGHSAEAFKLLAATLPTAAREEYHRLLIDEGEPLAKVLRAYAESGGRSAALGRDPRYGEWLARLLAALPLHDEGAGPAETPSAPLEPLTPKELQVLHYLAEGYSNAAIAEKLLVSDSTVRTHLRNVSAKLGTQSRTRAVAVARQHRLIP